MIKGDLVLIPFPFTDLSGSKNRPAVILIVDENDATVAFISTQLKWKMDTDLILKPSDQNGLKKESLIRLSKISTIDKKLILGKLGGLTNQEIQLLNSNLIKILKLDEG
jgi:mRNA interferase MazF